MHDHGKGQMRRIGHGKWRSGEGIAGVAVRGSGDTPERALARADRAAVGKPRWLATPASHGPPHRLPRCRGRATPSEGEGEEEGMEGEARGDHHGWMETNDMGLTWPPADGGLGERKTTWARWLLRALGK
jgi:hypothetical protein